MELSNQVCSLELSKQLKNLGFEQESLFWHIVGLDGTSDIRQSKPLNHILTTYSAYTVAELGEFFENGVWLPVKDEKRWLWVASNSKTKKGLRQYENTEADARAKMLIYLKENRLL
jgi:hypothetical protein